MRVRKLERKAVVRETTAFRFLMRVAGGIPPLPIICLRMSM